MKKRVPGIGYRIIKFAISIALFVCTVAFCTACGSVHTSNDCQYGVFIGIDNTELSKLYPYSVVVIDAQYFSREDIEQLREKGITVYSYLNIGSIEKYRPYYQEYSDLILGEYENWDEEGWIDVANNRWQKKCISLAKEYLDKGVEGLFIDNLDVYYQYNKPGIYNGITTILKEIDQLGTTIIINGGDYYVSEYLQSGSIHELIDGVNQECVFSTIDFEHDLLLKQEEEETEYYSKYIELCAANDLPVYLIEYTKDEMLIKQIKAYCKERGFSYYIADTIKLD